MKQQLVNVLTKLGFLGVMALVVASAQGQSLSNRVRANIPFDFAVADKTLPAGEYSISRVRPDDTVLLISKVDGRTNSMRFTSPVQRVSSKDKTTLVFNRYGDQYFLFQVWPAGATTGRQMVKSRREREIERKLAANPAAGKMAKNGRTVETVTIVGGLQ